MPLTLNLSNLSSRVARVASVGNAGVRRIAVNATASRDRQEEGLLGIYNAVEKFGRSLMSFAFNALKSLLTLDWKKLWEKVVGGVQFLLNFDWNTTDAQLDAQIKQAEIALAAAKGSLAGQSLGFAICGFAPAITTAVFNEPLGLYMMKELGEEAAEEIAGSLARLVSLQTQLAAKRAFFTIFKNYRTLLRGAALGIAQGLVFAGVLTQESVDKANKKRNEPWSFASALEESIDSIKDPEEQAYWEEFWEELGDSCIEAGFIIANSADSYFAMQKMANESTFGKDKTIEITLNRDAQSSTTP